MTNEEWKDFCEWVKLKGYTVDYDYIFSVNVKNIIFYINRKGEIDCSFHTVGMNCTMTLVTNRTPEQLKAIIENLTEE